MGGEGYLQYKKIRDYYSRYHCLAAINNIKNPIVDCNLTSFTKLLQFYKIAHNVRWGKLPFHPPPCMCGGGVT